MQIRQGYNRIVLLIGGFALKFPNIFKGERAFAHGLCCNIKEYELGKEARFDTRVADVYFRLPFGFMLAMKRYEVIDRPLTEDEFKRVPISNPDRKIGNYATNHKGDVVIIDYGHSSAWYIGRTQ